MHAPPTDISAYQGTAAFSTYTENLTGIITVFDLSLHQAKLATKQARHASRVAATLTRRGDDLSSKLTQARILRSSNRLTSSLNELSAKLKGQNLITLWQVVMSVTCAEAYLQDVLAAAAGQDPGLMSKSEQSALYAEVLAATSLQALSDDMRSRWARRWVSDGGPSRWIERLKRMGARGYANDLGSRLEVYWGVRHVVVHGAGVATSDFVRHHPGIVERPGMHIRLNGGHIKRLLLAVNELVGTTDRFFSKRYPGLVSASNGSSASPKVK